MKPWRSFTKKNGAMLRRMLCSIPFLTSACTPNTLFFSEGTKFALHAEFKPDASEPISSSLGYKRRIAAVVPPQYPQQASFMDWLRGAQNVHRGEALSLVSVFSVGTKPNENFTIENHFISGTAARIATARDAQSAVQALTVPHALVPVPASLQGRREALAEELRTMSEKRAQEILLQSEGDVSIRDKSARVALGEKILTAQDEAQVKALERAFQSVP